MALFARFSISAFVSIILLASSYYAHADKLRQSLFDKAEKVMQQAQEVDADVLAPVSYRKALEAYQKADKRYKRNQSVEKIQSDLSSAESNFRRAIEATKLARITFKSTIKARNDAISVKAKTLTAEKWDDAEEEFREAAESMEVGSLDKARKKSDKAEALYRDAELTAIKNSYLNQTRDFIAKARKEKVEKYAPKTLGEAKSLLASAEKELSENRYDTDYPRSLAKKSLYQAKHSLFLANQVKALKSGDVKPEDLLLTWEKPLNEIGDALDMAVEFDQGLDFPTAKLKAKVESLMKDSYELGELKAEMAKLEKEHAMLENRLGIQSERMAMQESHRKRLMKVGSLFSRHEAVVLTQGDNVIIRAVGLSFDPGSARVNTSNMQLLRKLQQVFKIFKDYNVVVEGHTDSFGGDRQNLELSEARANAVRQYFLMNMPAFSENRSSAKGYGESHPIANNETEAGRRKNRRIDLVFKPR